ncbi:VWFA and cache domain-containing protein CG16868 [Condylostylus longicornis]|uniref:VWFA and cache domain-containing protein CG16868 n=1 Tax=Condylostylus longicornis TaxID=2530218 RepID=UPI00244DFFC4|nr:VWFA and cache domain-containing protein CG16868 [Condylostylus longicornis]
MTTIEKIAASSNNNNYINSLLNNINFKNQSTYVPMLSNITSDYISSNNSKSNYNNTTLIIDNFNNSKFLNYNDQVPLLQLSLKPKQIKVDEFLNHTVTIINSEFPKNIHDTIGQTNTKLHFSQYLGLNQNITRKIIETNTTENNKYNVLDLVKNLQIRLKSIRNDELGVATIQEIFDAMDFTVQNQQDKSDKLKRISYRLSKKLEKAIHVITHLYNFFVKNITNISLEENEDETEDEFETQTNQQLYLNTLIQPCPFEDFSLQQNYNKHEIQVLNYLKNNDHRSFGSHSNGREIDEDGDVNYIANTKITEEFNTFNMEANHIKHLYFLSSSDHASDHQCQYYFNDLHFRYLYVSAIKKKHVFLLLDNGNAFNFEQLELLKLFVQNILKMLSNTDTITIVLISDEASPMILDNEETIANDNNYMYKTDIDGKRKISKFIENLNYTSTLTNHSRGFEYSFELLKKQNFSEFKPLLFLYATRGLLHKLTDKVNVLATIAKGQSSLNSPVVINTCAIVLDERRIMYEKQFLRDIAQQNYTKYDIDVSSWYIYDFYNLTGNLYVITKRHPERIIKISTAVFENLFLGNWRTDNTENLIYIENELQYHLPIYDYSTREVIVSMTRSIQRFGVIGLNLYLTDLAEDIIYFKNTEFEYAFMIDVKGITISHPAFSRPTTLHSNTYEVDIGLLENSKEFKESIKEQILLIENGNASYIERDNITKIYFWKRIQNAYIICLVSKSNGLHFNLQNSKAQAKTSNYQQSEHLLPLDLLYHRLDLVPPKNPICRHFRQIATLETGTVFLSASAFQSPFTYLKNTREHKESIRTHTAQSIMAYIKDSTSLLANPGLLSRIRNDVATLYHVMSYLKKRHLENGEFKKYIIRRYVTTTSGVTQIYPGCILGTDLEPSRRPWYRKAMKYPGKIISTEPYLDAGGAGFIVTIAHTIFEGKSNALHNVDTDIPAAIVAVDVPYAFFYRMIIDSTLFCSERNIKCLLIEDNGYLLGHPSFMEPSTLTINHRRPKEHLTHKESFVANDILNHKQLVRKQICANYQNRTSERYYIYNISSTEIFTNVVHGDRTKYQITTIPGTNIFAAVLNSTRDGGAFCPCSTVDRVCLNCNRMDQTDCECPCECPLKFSKNGEISMNIINRSSNDSDFSNIASYYYCEPPIEGLDVVNSMSYDWNTVLKACININCDLYSSQNECIGIMGCEWCQLDVDGNPFNSAFCTTQNSCFNGVLGAMTPYGDNDIGAAIVESVSQPAYSAIGPVGGAIIALCIVVGFAMYCYRQNLDSSIDQLYPESIQEDNFGLPLSRFNYDDCNGNNGLGDDDIIGGNGSHILHKNLIHPLANSIAVSEISPYHMSSGGYRRPNGESDNGYSTMTPHEDSDMCFTLVEPLINTNKRLSMSADSMSISTSISSPTNQGDSNKANISKRNQDFNLKYNERSSPTSSGIGNNSPALTKQILEQTILPQQMSPHHILAPVTVHRHMEASS